uniref:Chlororespiratory reduction 41 n=1 Tax=Kalanchoe fedtschenkoi TaxID=63787 RepID=A0A7N0VGG6_KALFE
MASSTAIHFLFHPNHIRVDPSPLPTRSNPARRLCCTKSESDFPNPYPTSSPEFNNADSFPIEKRRKSEIIRERKVGLVKPEPKNLEIGWKRTKPINLEKLKGYMIIDFLEKMEELMGRELFGSVELLAKTGEIVAERAREEAKVLREEGEVEERMVTELFRVLRLMEMDLAMVKAAVKEETLNERLEVAKARCRQAILVAQSF